MLDCVNAFKGIGNRDEMEGRFVDEKKWRPWAYFEDLWQRIPIGQDTLKRLRKEGIEVEDGLTESRARIILHNYQNAKPATAYLLQKLRNLGIDTQQHLNRGQAKNLLKEYELKERKRAAEIQEKNQRIEDEQKLPDARARLAALAQQIRTILPEWEAPDFRDLEQIEEYIRLVEEALDYALLFDEGHLQGGPFSDPTRTGSDYYLEFEGEFNVSELRTFQGRLFAGYLRKGDDGFDHLTALRKSFSNLKVSKL
jgi:hypothetical protein